MRSRSRSRSRQVAIASNVAFITYGIVGDVIPVLTLHVLLLPLNIWLSGECLPWQDEFCRPARQP